MKNKLRMKAVLAAASALVVISLCMGGCWHNGGYEAKGNFTDGNSIDQLDKEFQSALGLTSDKIFVDLTGGQLSLMRDGTVSRDLYGPELYLRYKEPKHNTPYRVTCFINGQRMSLAYRKEYESDNRSRLPSLYDLWELIYGINAPSIEKGCRIEFHLTAMTPKVIKYDWENYGYGLKNDSKEYFVSAKEVNKDNYSGYALVLSGVVLPSMFKDDEQNGESLKGEEQIEGLLPEGDSYDFIKPLKYHDVL